MTVASWKTYRLSRIFLVVFKVIAGPYLVWGRCRLKKPSLCNACRLHKAITSFKSKQTKIRFESVRWEADR